MYDNIQAEISPLHAPIPGHKVKTVFFSENDHVAYQIKGHDTNNNMQAIILPLNTPSTPGAGSKGQTVFILKVVILKKMPLYTNEFFHTYRYNKLGMVHCIYQGVTGYNFQLLLHCFLCRLIFAQQTIRT